RGLPSLHSLVISVVTFFIYTLSLHDALPILADRVTVCAPFGLGLRALDQRAAAFLVEVGIGRTEQEPGETLAQVDEPCSGEVERDRKSTRLNSSHVKISYAVFCLKKKISSHD